MTLKEIILDIENLPDDLVIFARKLTYWELDSQAALVLETDIDAIGIEMEELTYFLEVSIAKEVIDVWREWHKGNKPSEAQRLDAVLYYANNDAYMPI